MTFEKEITVETKLSFDKIDKELKDNGFVIKDEYDVYDKYLVQKDYLSTNNYLDILGKCVLIRNIVGKNNLRYIMYKYKKYNDKEEIVKQGSIKCEVESLEKAEELFNALDYSKLIDLHDHVTVYVNDKIELHVQEVNNKHIYIEIEAICNHIDKKYINVDDMIKDLEKYDFLYDNSNYFVKKAEIELKESLK